MWNNSLRELWNISLRSMWNEICPHSRQRIFHICEANISQRSYFTCPKGQISLKKAQRDCVRLFSWQGREDSVSSLRRKAEFLISALLRSSVFRGSDSPPDCHSLPLPFKSRQIKTQKNTAYRSMPYFWCEKRDLNPYGVTTRPSNVRVCQFRHSRVTYIIILRLLKMSIPFLKKVIIYCQNFSTCISYTAPMSKMR